MNEKYEDFGLPPGIDPKLFEVPDLDPRLKAVGYVRVSKAEKNVPQVYVPIEEQKKRIRAYCELKNLNLTTIYEETSTIGSEVIAARKEGRKLMLAAHEGKVLNLVAVSLDRLFVNAMDTLSTMHRLDSMHVNIHLLDVGGSMIDTGSSIGRMIFHVITAFAQMESAMKRDAAKVVLGKKLERGESWTRKPPFGYECYTDGEMRTNPRNGKVVEVKKLRKNPVEIELLAETISCWRGGISPQEIAKRLNGMGYTRRGPLKNPLTYTYVRDILTDWQRWRSLGILPDGTPFDKEQDTRITVEYDPPGKSKHRPYESLRYWRMREKQMRQPKFDKDGKLIPRRRLRVPGCLQRRYKAVQDQSPTES
jgi:DNA invertase Pin-like site-specific DNA recombinase